MFYFGEFIQSSNHSSNSLLITKPLSTENNSSEWINQIYLNIPWLVIVPISFISDNFNLFGLNEKISHYNCCLKVIKGNNVEIPPDSTPEEISMNSINLYALIHSRYILTYSGVKDMQKKYDSNLFGFCPRVSCNKSKLLPIGLSSEINISTVKLYCTCCQEVYNSNNNIDGAFFGPYFPIFFHQALKNDIEFPKSLNINETLFGIPIFSNSKF